MKCLLIASMILITHNISWGQSVQGVDQKVRDPFASALAPQSSQNTSQDDGLLSHPAPYDSIKNNLSSAFNQKQLNLPVVIQKQQEQQKNKKVKSEYSKSASQKKKFFPKQTPSRGNNLTKLIGVVQTSQGKFAILEKEKKHYIISEEDYWGNQKIKMIQEKKVIFQQGRKETILSLQGK
ncbi:MAG: hypothetical protein HQM14_18395 [SAR324 cluster bacterium]|nr:hypothetical protein [SAR324 cluster bacterium]